MIVYKQVLRWMLDEDQILEIPDYSALMTFQNQKEKPTIWYSIPDEVRKLNPQPFPLKMRIRLVTTGKEFNDGRTYLGSAQFIEGDIVLHCWVQ